VVEVSAECLEALGNSERREPGAEEKHTGRGCKPGQRRLSVRAAQTCKFPDMGIRDSMAGIVPSLLQEAKGEAIRRFAFHRE